MIETISEEYRDLLHWEHENTPGKWGHTAKMYVNTIVKNSEGRTNWLDYGAGHGGLGKAVRERFGDTYNITEFEPSRPDSQPPEPTEYVVCIDVLEHIEPDFLENVFEDLKRVTVERGYYTISCRLASKILKDGRNAHLIVEEPDWWMDRLEKHFDVLEAKYEPHDKNLRVVVEPFKEEDAE